MPNEMVIAALEQDISKREQELAGLRQALAILKGHLVVAVAGHQSAPNPEEYRGLGIVQATEKFLREVGEPKSTTEIADALLSRGLTTTSKKFGSAVYSTLDNAKQFKRIGNGRQGVWELQEEKR